MTQRHVFQKVPWRNVGCRGSHQALLVKSPADLGLSGLISGSQETKTKGSSLLVKSSKCVAFFCVFLSSENVQVLFLPNDWGMPILSGNSQVVFVNVDIYSSQDLPSLKIVQFPWLHPWYRTGPTLGNSSYEISESSKKTWPITCQVCETLDHFPINI